MTDLVKANGAAPKRSIRVTFEPCDTGPAQIIHADRESQLATLGASQDEFTLHAIRQLGAVIATTRPADAAERTNALLQAVAAFEPADELEGMIAVQSVALHEAALDCLGRAMRDSRLEGRAVYLSQANKCARTFAALIQTLNVHRGKTVTQRFVVEQVNVQAGGQAVVGTVAGVGGRPKARKQPHEHGDESRARYAALPSPQSSGQAVPAAGEQGEAPLSPSRRSRKWRAKGKSERADARPVHGGRHRGETCNPGAAEERARSSDGVTS